MPVARLAFLYCDLRLSQQTIARLLGVSARTVAANVRRDEIVEARSRAGAYGPTILRELVQRAGLDPKGFTSLVDWMAVRPRLAHELRGTPLKSPAWDRLDDYLHRLTLLARAAEARVTKGRLRFLHGDLGMKTAEIAELLDVGDALVGRAVRRHDVQAHQSYGDDLGEGVLAELAHRLGVSYWPIDASAASRWGRYWPAVKKGVREGLLQLARHRDLDLAVLDEFITAVPAIAAARKARLAAKAA